MKHEEDEGFDNSADSGEESEIEQKPTEWSRNNRSSYTPYTVPSKFGHQDDIVSHPKSLTEELNHLRRDYERKHKLLVAETNAKLAAQHQFLTKLATFIKNAFPNGKFVPLFPGSLFPGL